MKTWTKTVVAIISIAVIICTLFAVLQGKALGFEATTVVVGISSVIVFGLKKTWNLLKKKKGENTITK